ncbi:uncharacterized protein Dwil_GK15941 [Drosophila willistoni]|uniref:Uncharacterized protein n=1 Tax=Drosophila willistoni TaxID=7260 RepID=B4NQ60_DROWI|nr:UPF0729 protein GD16342 [Drosophila willistoni]XP_046867647.1 UPF0729 protein GD16342 [Drosophila willistoni]EDW86285.1 uncharacterized protein Dwil_GK15941 [Drosophila willistoni]
MVCVPCFIIPLLLYIWHKFIQPIILRYWNPWEKKDAQGNIIKAGPDFPFECKGGVCPFVPGSKGKDLTVNTDNDTRENTTTSTTTADSRSTAEPVSTSETKKQI